MAERIKKPGDDEQPALANFIACNRGPRHVDPLLERQKLAGEEDQSVPGWDQGA